MMKLHRDREGRDTHIFVFLLIFVVVAGVGLLAWGQYNTAGQVYDVGFVRYQVGEQLQHDKDYVRTEEDEPLYQAALDAGQAWSEQAAASAREGTFVASSAAKAYPNAPEMELHYTVYDQGGEVTVVLLHAYNETREQARRYAAYWWDKGCNILLPELRGDGEGYNTTTFGVWESYDLYDLLARESLLDRRVVVHGEGVGAAAGILLASRGNEAGIDLLVADTVYDNLKSLELRQLKRQFSLGNVMVGIFLDRIVRQETGIAVKEVDLSDAAAQCTLPALFVVGGADGFAGSEDTRSVFEAWQGEADWLELDGVRHGMGWAAAKETYAAALDRASAFLFA